MQIVLWIAAIAVGLFAIDRLALWAEERGWIYWRKKKPRTGAMSSMLAEMNVFTNPSAHSGGRTRRVNGLSTRVV